MVLFQITTLNRYVSDPASRPRNPEYRNVENGTLFSTRYPGG